MGRTLVYSELFGELLRIVAAVLMRTLAWRLPTVAKLVNAVDHGQAGHIDVAGVVPFEVRHLSLGELC